MPDDETKALYGLSNTIEDQIFDNIKISGYVTSCEIGNGRHSADRYFLTCYYRVSDNLST